MLFHFLGVILLILSLCLIFVEKHRYKIVFFCMFPIPLLDDGESYMPKPVVEIYRSYQILISYVFSEHKI